MRFHLFPFRTEKLSSLAPMVLRFSRGRVGSRLFKVRLKSLTFFCLYMCRRVYRHGILFSDLKEKACYPPPKFPACAGDLFSLMTLTTLRTLMSLKILMYLISVVPANPAAVNLSSTVQHPISACFRTRSARIRIDAVRCASPVGNIRNRPAACTSSRTPRNHGCSIREIPCRPHICRTSPTETSLSDTSGRSCETDIRLRCRICLPQCNLIVCSAPRNRFCR